MLKPLSNGPLFVIIQKVTVSVPVLCHHQAFPVEYVERKFYNYYARLMPKLETFSVITYTFLFDWAFNIYFIPN
jgi:hypothetical protein